MCPKRRDCKEKQSLSTQEHVLWNWDKMICLAYLVLILKADSFTEENGLLNQELSEMSLTKTDQLYEKSNLSFRGKKNSADKNKET